MTCGFCGLTFDVSEGQVDCPGCPLSGNCGYVRCPRCGFDNPREAALVKVIRGWLRRGGAEDQSSTQEPKHAEAS